jgi:hypothetical protein
MPSASIGLIGILLFFAPAVGGAEVDDSAAPIVEQLLARASALELGAEQIGALELIRDRRAQTLITLTERLRTAEAQSTIAAEGDVLTLMQAIGRLQVLSGREALQHLTPAQRQRWAVLQIHAPRKSASVLPPAVNGSAKIH